MARKTVLICDQCHAEIDAGTGSTMRLLFTDARKGSKQADLCTTCSAAMPGFAVARRGRKPSES